MIIKICGKGQIFNALKFTAQGEISSPWKGEKNDVATNHINGYRYYVVFKYKERLKKCCRKEKISKPLHEVG